MSRLFPVIIMENSLCFHVLCQGRPIIRRAWSRAISLRSVIPASFSGDINVVGWAGGPRRPEKMPGHNRAEGIPADGANYGNAGPSGRLPVEMLCGHRLLRQLDRKSTRLNSSH